LRYAGEVWLECWRAFKRYGHRGLEARRLYTYKNEDISVDLAKYLMQVPFTLISSISMGSQNRIHLAFSNPLIES
jgi:hypothetical protein